MAAKRPTVCKYCQRGDRLTWRQIEPSKWRLYETDADGRPEREHRCLVAGTGTAGQQQTAPVQSSDPDAQPGDAIAGFGGNAPTPTAPNPYIMPASSSAPGQPTAPTAPTADSFDPQPILDIAATYEAIAEAENRDRVERERAEQRERESRHDPIVQTYGHADRMAESRIPTLDRDYLIDTATLAAIQRVIRIADDTGIPQNVGVHGPAGSGKTTMGIQIGAIRRGPTFVIEAAAKQTADEWYGEAVGLDKQTGAVLFRESHFVKGIETAGATVLINDVALLQSRTVQNGLNELLDPSTRSTFVEQLGRNVAVAPGVVIIGTWNVGAEYTGASDLSAQILDRFRSGALFEVPYPTNGALVHIVRARTGVAKRDAERLSKLYEWLTTDEDPIPVSTRGLIAAASHIVGGATIGHAIYFTVLGDLDQSERARAYGIIDVKLADTVPPTEQYDEQQLWQTPTAGEYVALGDVIAAAAPEQSEQDSSDSSEQTAEQNSNG